MSQIAEFRLPSKTPQFLVYYQHSKNILFKICSEDGWISISIATDRILSRYPEIMATGPIDLIPDVVKDLKRICKDISKDSTIFDINRKILRIGPYRAFKSLRKLEKIRKKNFQPIF